MSLKNSEKLKELQKTRDKFEAKFKSLRIEQSEISKNTNSIKNKIAEIDKQIIELESMFTEVQITEHAILRYIERVIGIDLEEIKDKICPDKNKEAIKTLGNGKYGVETHDIVVRNNKVVTVIKK